jgi:hypothetical protein
LKAKDLGGRFITRSGKPSIDARDEIRPAGQKGIAPCRLIKINNIHEMGTAVLTLVRSKWIRKTQVDVVSKGH